MSLAPKNWKKQFFRCTFFRSWFSIHVFPLYNFPFYSFSGGMIFPLYISPLYRLFTSHVTKVCLPKFATDIIVYISRPMNGTLDLKSSAESPGIWL